MKAEEIVADVTADDFDAMFIPGGLVARRFAHEQRSAALRARVRLGEEADVRDLPRPQIRISAQLVRGRTLTGYASIADDIRNAGGLYRDQPAILGHAHPKIIAAIKAAADHGTSFGIPNPLEVTMAKLICSLVPGIQKVRMTQFRHGSVHVRHPPGARVHEAGQDHQIRWLLSRSRGFVARQGW